LLAFGGRISKRGNTYLRELFIQGAQVSFLSLKRDRSALGEWLRGVESRRHGQMAFVALANKMVRICCKVLEERKSVSRLSRARRHDSLLCRLRGKT
jgi:hypothetical protein